MFSQAFKFLLIGCLFQSIVVAQEAGEAAAVVVALQGEIILIRNDGESKILSRRDEIQVGDVLETSNDAWIQLRFSDNARLTLNCSSSLQITDYQYLDRNSDRVSLHLNRGRMRTITGAIQRSNYRFTTDIAEIEISGTDFEVEIVSESENIFGVYDGAITVSNDVDYANIGFNRAFDFARVTADAPPERLPNSPFTISNTLLSGTQGLC